MYHSEYEVGDYLLFDYDNSGHHANIVNMLIDRKLGMHLCYGFIFIGLFSNTKAEKRLFDVYAETKSVKEVVLFDYAYIFIVYRRTSSVHVSGCCEEYNHNRVSKR